MAEGFSQPIEIVYKSEITHSSLWEGSNYHGGNVNKKIKININKM